MYRIGNKIDKGTMEAADGSRSWTLQGCWKTGVIEN
jgi:hypothetical protein